MMNLKKLKTIAVMVLAISLSACTVNGAPMESPTTDPTTDQSATETPTPEEEPQAPAIPAGWQEISLESLTVALPGEWVNIEDRGDWGESTLVWDFLGPWSDDPVDDPESASYFSAQTGLPDTWTEQEREYSAESDVEIPANAETFNLTGAVKAAQLTEQADGQTAISVWIKIADGRAYFLQLSSPTKGESVLKQIVNTIAIKG